MAARKKIRTAAALATTAAAVTAGALPAAHASQEQPDAAAKKPPLVTWRNGSTGRYLTVKDNSKHKHADIVTTKTDRGKPEHWYMVRHGTSPLGFLDTYQMKNENSGLCADYIGRIPPGSHVEQSGCGKYVWAERSVLNRQRQFLGWSLTPNGGTESVSGHLCEDTRTHNVSIVASFPVDGSNTPKRCLWH